MQVLWRWRKPARSLRSGSATIKEKRSRSPLSLALTVFLASLLFASAARVGVKAAAKLLTVQESSEYGKVKQGSVEALSNKIYSFENVAQKDVLQEIATGQSTTARHASTQGDTGETQQTLTDEGPVKRNNQAAEADDQSHSSSSDSSAGTREASESEKPARKDSLESTSSDASRQALSRSAGRELRQDRPKVLAVVGVYTSYSNFRRRAALRMTWFPDSPLSHKQVLADMGMAFRFVLGNSSSGGPDQSEVEKEMKQYGDFERLDVVERYLELSVKTRVFFQTMYERYDAEFYVKADDDIYLRKDRLLALLNKHRSTPRAYIGCLKRGGIVSNPKQKWYEPHAYILGKEYFLHGYGPIYILHRDLVKDLYAMSAVKLRKFVNEDVTVGSWMMALDSRHVQCLDLCRPTCIDTAIALWDIPQCSGLCNPTKKLLELHANPVCSGIPNPTYEAPDETHT